MTLFTLGCLVAVSAAAVDVDSAGREAWCIEPGNLERVIRSAEVLNFGVAAGADGRMIDPVGPRGGMSLRRWRSESLSDFRGACDAAYDAHFGLASSEDATEPASSDDESVLAKLGLATLPALLGAAAGAGAGFQLSKLSRAEERRHQEAQALSKGLADLTAELDQLIAKVPSESVEGKDKLAVRRRAVDLLSQIPASSPCVGPATEALAELISTLAGSKLPHPQLEVDALEADKKEVAQTVNRVISGL
jgi:hypothetical protein